MDGSQKGKVGGQLAYQQVAMQLSLVFTTTSVSSSFSCSCKCRLDQAVKSISQRTIMSAFTFRWTNSRSPDLPLPGDQRAQKVFAEYYEEDVGIPENFKRILLKIAPGYQGPGGCMFQETVQFDPPFKALYYRFEVDGLWVMDVTAPAKTTAEGFVRNYLYLSGGEHATSQQAIGLQEEMDLTPDQSAMSSAESRPYSYEKLDFDRYEIRILRLSDNIEEGAPIVCSLEHASLLDPGPYIALSYCVSVLNCLMALRALSCFLCSSLM